MQERHLHWVKAKKSAAMNACVELAFGGSGVRLRNSRRVDKVLDFTQEEMAAFFDGVRKGEFDHLLDRSD